MLLRTRFDAKFKKNPPGISDWGDRYSVPNGTIVLLLQHIGEGEGFPWNQKHWAHVLWDGQEWWADTYFLEGLEGEKFWKASVE